MSFSKPWNSQGIIGIFRFLNRIWDLVSSEPQKKDGLKLTKEAQEKLKKDLLELERLEQLTIKKVTEDLENIHFNTAISALMEYTNRLSDFPKEYLPKKYLKTLVLLLSPFAPHLAEELGKTYLHERGLISQSKWPSYDKKLVEEKQFKLLIQVNGKLKATLEVDKGISEASAQKSALPLVQKYLGKKKIKKVIFVPDRLINFVV